MNKATNSIKYERLNLNFTVQERHCLREYHLKSNAVSESDFVRKAVRLYIDLHQRVVTGAEIVLRNEIDRRQVHVPIPKVWNRNAMPIPKRETPRQNFETKMDAATKQALNALVEQGAAPSVARLAWAAIGTYALIIERKELGFDLMGNQDGRFESIASDNEHTQPTS